MYKQKWATAHIMFFKVGHCDQKDEIEWKYFLLLHNYVKLLALTAQNSSELSKTSEVLSINCGQLVNNSLTAYYLAHRGQFFFKRISDKAEIDS